MRAKRALREPDLDLKPGPQPGLAEALAQGRILVSGLRLTSFHLSFVLASKSGEDSGGDAASCGPKTWSKTSQEMMQRTDGAERRMGGNRGAEETREGCKGTRREAKEGQGARGQCGGTVKGIKGRMA